LNVLLNSAEMFIILLPWQVAQEEVTVNIVNQYNV